MEIPTSTALAKDEMTRFWTSDEAEVLCVHGDWGVGKTHAWNEVRKSTAPKKTPYSYVSLFGLESIEAAKLAIMEGNDVVKDLTNTDSKARRYLEELNKQSSFFNWLNLLIPGKATEVGKLFQAVRFAGISNQVVCFDDIERKSANLKLKDLMGLASFLSEQRNCSVILIMNDGAIQDSEKEEYKKYHEKVIDKNIIFSPSPAEAANIALPGDDRLHVSLKKHCVRLGITNIRVMQRIQRFATEIGNALKGYSQDVLDYILRSLVLIVWLRYDSRSPGLDLAKKAFAPGGREAFKDSKWLGEIDAYGVMYFTEVEGMFCDVVERGYFIPEQVEKIATEKNANGKAEEAGRVWQLYRNSLGDDDEEFTKALIESSTRLAPFIHLGDMNHRVETLRELKREADADELCIVYAKEAPDYAIRRSVTTFDRDAKLDEKLEAAIAERRDRMKISLSADKVIEQVAQSRGWNQGDLDLIFALSEDDWYKVYKGYKGDLLPTMIEMPHWFGGSGAGKETVRRSRAALTRIADDTPLNALRIKDHLRR